MSMYPNAGYKTALKATYYISPLGYLVIKPALLRHSTVTELTIFATYATHTCHNVAPRAKRDYKTLHKNGKYSSNVYNFSKLAGHECFLL